MSEYDKVKVKKLVFKGEKKKSKKRKHKKEGGEKDAANQKDDDAQRHGGWMKLMNIADMTGAVAIEFGNNSMYMKALDNGLFTLGAPHDEGEGPNPEEIFTAIRIDDAKIALKSGYGKYIGTDKKGLVVGRSDAVGAMEQWAPMFEDGKVAIMSNLSLFLTVSSDDDILADKEKAGNTEFVWIRSLCEKEEDPNKDIPKEEQGTLAEIEENYVRRFQKFQDKKLKMSKDTMIDVKKAKLGGNLHETLLDRRSKMKADRYCK